MEPLRLNHCYSNLYCCIVLGSPLIIRVSVDAGGWEGGGSEGATESVHGFVTFFH